MAKRYTVEERQKVIDFVANHNKENGRGGKSAAAKEFGVNSNSIRNWMSGSKPPRAVQPRAKKARAAAPGAKAPVAKESNTATLERMIQIQNQIDGLKAEFEGLKGKL